jgi:hypothetical protein
MPRHISGDGPQRRSCPSVEGLEARELPSHVVPSAGHTHAAALPNPAVIQQVVQLLYGPNSQTPMTPTPRAVRRQVFVARWEGQYVVGPPRFSDRASTIHIYGVSGGSNQFLKGKFQIALFPPADPTATPTPGDPYADQVTGIAALFPQNILQSSSTVVLDLNATPSAGTAAQALPTHLSWTYDFNASAGAYAAPQGFLQGAGILDIKYIPDPRPHPGTMGSGTAIVTFQGLINASRLVSPVSKVIS